MRDVGGESAGMKSPTPLPADLGRSFSVATARAHGVSPARLRAGDLDTPFHGVRMTGDPAADLTAEHRRLALAFAAKSTPDAFFSHVTAAVLWGLPLPSSVLRKPGIDVAVLTPRRNPRGRGVRGHEVDAALVAVIRHPVHGVLLASPASTWAMLGGVLRDPYDLVAAGDAVVRTPQHPADPVALAALADLAAATRAGRRVGVPALREALPRIRTGSSSRPETWTRLTLVDHGLPEPELAWEVCDANGQFLARVDLAYPQARVAIEYEGEHHLRDVGQWTRDILRYDLLAAEGWRVIRVTKEELTVRPAALVARVRAVLRAADVRP